ncbi:hypothetical protein MIND_00756400 [Mycena indigotica]|uniref:Uncharacterized protein n=1 Tax=Mycena indigotica TaxID=2126181 RepID=A0A8H6W1B7_9AGAR|nr:uncharacterized protein MIND_00756400 [Mycena indigotica]KAF7301904.1 hypothetical protein MIND_00756400 [Mycena indigotica]
MSGSEETKVVTVPIPAQGAFAAFKIDPISTLPPDMRNDAEAVAACQKLVNKSYIGLVVKRHGLFQHWAPYNACTFDFLLPGMPMNMPLAGIDPSMSLPVEPMTIKDHPGYPPLRPSNPLPWNDCYISPFWRVELRSPTVYESSEKVHFRISIEEQARRHTFTNEVFMRHQTLLLQMHRNNEAHDCGDVCRTFLTEPYSAPTSPTGSNHSEDWDENESSEYFSESWSDGVYSDELEVLKLDLKQQMFPELDPSAVLMVTGTFTHDLETLEELIHPEGFYEEAWLLRRIIDEAQPRVEAARLRAKATAAAQDAADFDAKTDVLTKESTATNALSESTNDTVAILPIESKEFSL